VSDLADRLASRGMSESEARKKVSSFAAAERALGRSPEKRWFVPGRIEVLGKHTDYAGGPSLLCTVERGFCVVAARRSNNMVRVSDAGRGQSAEFPLSANINVPTGWPNYVATVVRRVAGNFPEATGGVDIAFASDLPHAAGLSSSSAMMIATFTALADANRLCERDDFAPICAVPEELAAYLACIENGQSYRGLEGGRGVGTFGGSEDHTAILCCRAGHVSHYRFCPARLEQHIPVPSGWTIEIASSGAKASKAGAARELYNHASLGASAVLGIANAASGMNHASLDAAVRASDDAADKIRAALRNSRRSDFSAAELLDRFDQFTLESQELIPAAAAAFAGADARSLGEIVDRSQAAAERLLKNQVPETVALARSARELGALAASAFGAGFGGSVWALVERERATQFLSDWLARYATDFPGRATASEFFLTGAGPSLTVL